MIKKLFWAFALALVVFVAACSTPDEKKMTFYHKGKALYETGEFIKARLELKNALQIDPKFAQAYHFLGQTELKLKNGKLAFQAFNSAVKFDPDLIDSRLAMGKMFAGAAMWDKAMEQVVEILEREPDNDDAKFLHTSILLRQKKFKTAKSVLYSASSEAKNSVDFHMLLATYYKMTNLEEMSVQTLATGLDKNPDSIPIILGLVKHYGAKGSLDKVEGYLHRAIALSPESDTLKFNLAWLYFKTNAPDKALDQVNRVITSHPENDKLRIAGAVLLMKGGLKDESIKILEQGVSMHPEVYAYYGLLSEIKLKANQISEAETVLNHFIELGDIAARTDLVKARLNLSKLALLRKDFLKAEVLIDEVLNEDAGNVDAHYLKGRIFLSQGDGPGAVSKFRAVVEDYPDNMDGYLGLASAHSSNKDYNLAMDVLKTALRKQPDSTGILQAMVKMNLKQNNPLAAEKNLKRIISLDPYNLGSIAGLGDFYLAMNRYEDAIEQYRLLKNREQGEALGYFKTAAALARQKKMNEAIDKMTQGYETNKKSSVFITSLARLYIKEGRYSEAIDKLNEAVKVDPNNMFAWFTLAETNERKKNYQAAMEIYEQIIQKQPDSWMAANNLAFYISEFRSSKEELDRAQTLAQKADELNPGSPLVKDTMGWILYKKGEIKLAKDYIEAAYQQMPENDSISYHFGMVCYRLGEEKTAAQILEKILEKNTDFIGRDMAVKVYQKI